MRKKIEFELEKLQRIAAPWRDRADLIWLADRSAADPATLGPGDVLRLLYPAGEKVLCFTNEFSQGEALWPDEAPPAEGRCGVWFLPQPVSGQYLPNPDGKPGKDGEPPPPSRRTGRCVTAFRYLVIESDSAPLRDWRRSASRRFTRAGRGQSMRSCGSTRGPTRSGTRKSAR